MLTTTATRIAFENRWIRLREDAIRYGDGTAGVYAFIERPRYAIVAAIEDGHVWMVEQWRHPLRRRSWELPMGVAPGGDATPIEEAARIELREETGVTAARMDYLCEIAPAPALLAQTGALFLATGLTQGPQALEHGEQDLVAARLPLADVISRILSGEIADGVTVAAFGLLRLREII
jgi:8-oxo-dGTP pyrophosphatase MutT (NUDIX family)